MCIKKRFFFCIIGFVLFLFTCEVCCHTLYLAPLAHHHRLGSIYITSTSHRITSHCWFNSWSLAASRSPSLPPRPPHVLVQPPYEDRRLLSLLRLSPLLRSLGFFTSHHHQRWSRTLLLFLFLLFLCFYYIAWTTHSWATRSSSTQTSRDRLFFCFVLFMQLHFYTQSSFDHSFHKREKKETCMIWLEIIHSVSMK